jgi:peptide/nickel transport system substrate-binding protein
MVNVDSLSVDCRFHIIAGVIAFHARQRMILCVAMRILLLAGLSTLVIACGGEQPRTGAKVDTGGTLVIAMPADPGAIFPPFAFTGHGRMIASQIYDHLADVGPEMNTIGDAGFVPQLAERWDWSNDSLSIAFHLNPRARWHDGRPVTARDVKFTLGLYANPDLGGQTIEEHARVDSVTTPDSLTVVYWFANRSPVQFLDAAAQVQILPAHLLEGIPVKSLREADPPLIGSGRFRLRRWEKGTSGELVADSANYRGRAKLDRVIWTTSTGATTAATQLLSGEADVFDAMRPEDVREAARNESVRVIALPGLEYALVHFNLRDAGNQRPHPLFGNRELRRALAMSVDRAQIVRNILDTFALVALGPTVRAYSTTDSLVTQLPFDTVRANRALDSLGWSRRDSRGTRMRGGRALAFNLILPTSSTTRNRAAVLIQAQLRRVGVRMDIEAMNYPAFVQRWHRRQFDAAFGTFNMGSTPGATGRIWSTAALEPGGYNFGSYSNPAFDAVLDSALRATDLRRARGFFTRAYGIINEDAPALWMYEPKNLIGIHRRVSPVAMRRGAWWFGLADWSIPPANRLPRDEIPSAR